jgi:hypothetical protein
MRCLVAATPNMPLSVSIYLVSLVVSAMLHYRQDCKVWRSQIRSYPWYSQTCLCRLGSRPSTPPPPPRPHHPAPISAPQPRRPIQLPARAVLSYLHKVEKTHVPAAQDPGDLPPVRRASQQAMQQATAPSRLTVLYPLHIQAVWGATSGGPSSRAAAGGDNAVVVSPTSARSQIPHPHRSAPSTSAAVLPPDGGPLPLWNWPRADIMTLPPPPSRRKGKGKAVVRPAPAVDPPRRSPRGRRRSSARSQPTSVPTSPV